MAVTGKENQKRNNQEQKKHHKDRERDYMVHDDKYVSYTYRVFIVYLKNNKQKNKFYVGKGTVSLSKL